jgi:hypothetical protein
MSDNIWILEALAAAFYFGALFGLWLWLAIDKATSV